jgi:hypothetical protein
LEKLAHFNEVESITQLFSRANLSVLDPNFLQALSRIDNAISFITHHPTYKESKIYLIRFRQLQTRGLTMIKSYIVATLRNHAKMATVANIQPDEFHTIAYGKFRATANNLRPLCKEIESRVQQREYQTLLNDCHYCYYHQRHQLLFPVVDAKIKEIIKSNQLSKILQDGCAYLFSLCQQEFELFQRVFSTYSTAMRTLLEGFGDKFYESIRPLFIRAHQVDLLCEAAHTLKSEILFSIQERGEAVQALQPIISRMLEDIQERLIFLSQNYILENISTFVPSTDDLNYPQKIIASKSQTNLIIFPFIHLQLINIYQSINQSININNQIMK